MAAIAQPQSIPGPSSASEAGPSGSSAAASANVFKRLHPEQYLSRFLAQGYRPDGRKVVGWRNVSINAGSISTANGSALVRMGDTTMVCGIKAEIAEPDAASPNEGYIIPNIDLPALCSPNFKPGPPAGEAQVLSNQLNDLLISSCTIPLESLCIAPGKAVWALYIDVVCINYDGNAFDTAVIAVMAALKNARLPGVKYNEDTTKCTASADKFPIPLGRIPLSCTFGIFQSSHLLPDPTAFETPLLPTAITIAIDETGRASSVRQEGLGGIKGSTGEAVLSRAWGMAEERVGVLRSLLDEQEEEVVEEE